VIDPLILLVSLGISPMETDMKSPEKFIALSYMALKYLGSYTYILLSFRNEYRQVLVTLKTTVSL